MAKDKISQEDDQPVTRFSSAAEAQAVVERFLCGEAVNGDLYREALHYLEADDSAVLATLAANASGILPADALRDDTACGEILESLEAYASLGAAAAERMPEVHHHLTACLSCRQDLDAAHAALGRTTGNFVEVHAGDPVSPRPLIIAQDDRWLLLTKEQETPVPLDQVSLEPGSPLDPWKLELSSVIMTRGSESGEIPGTAEDEAAESITLKTVLPGGLATIQLVVSKGGRGESGRNQWRLSLSGTEFTEINSLSVKLLNERGDVTEFETTVFPDRSPQVFDMIPDPGTRYQLIFDGVTPQGAIYSHRLVLPLAAAAHETDSRTP